MPNNTVTKKYVSHGSGSKLESLEPMDMHGDPDLGEHVFATKYKQMALAYTGNRWGDRDIEQGSTDWGKNWALKEMRPGAFDEVFPGDKVGYLYELLTDTFKIPSRSLGSDFEVVSASAVTPVIVREIKDIQKALLSSGVKLVKYEDNVSSGAFDKAVDRMAARVKRMSKHGFEQYVKWVRETNPILATKIQAVANNATKV